MSLFRLDDIRRYFDDADLVRLTVAQVQKDFGMFGMGLQYSGNLQNAYAEVFGQMLDIIRELDRSDSSRLRALLYQIDLSENTIRKEADAQPGVGLHELIADLVLQREMKKVLLRQYFRQNPDKL